MIIIGSSIIPTGSLVYISTDDPDGVCKDCRSKWKYCYEYPVDMKPIGCPNDVREI